MAKKTSTNPERRRHNVKQTDVPSCQLAQALRIPEAIANNYALGPATPLKVAASIEIQPTSSTFKMLCGASIAYGLTIGGYNAGEIQVTDLGKRIVRPTSEGDDHAAKREAFLKPVIVGDFLRKYNGHPIPKEDIAINVLESLGVPRDRAAKTLELIVEGAKSLGMLREIKGQRYVDLATEVPPAEGSGTSAGVADLDNSGKQISEPPQEVPSQNSNPTSSTLDDRKRLVFITHGKNTSFLEPIKGLLSFGGLEPVVAVEQQTVSKPVPDKVLEDMRRCGAAIIHVDAERTLMDSEAKEHTLLNENVLIEIGAAMALYGRRFILLVKQGVTLPSNLQGLYEVRYEGDQLDNSTMIKLMEAIKDIKNHELPEEETSN